MSETCSIPSSARRRSSRLVWWMILGVVGAMLLVTITAISWRSYYAVRQATLVAAIEQSGGVVSYYDRYVQTPDGRFVEREFDERRRTVVPIAVRERFPNFCSNVIGVNGLGVLRHQHEDGLNDQETVTFVEAAKGFRRLRRFSLKSSSLCGAQLRGLPTLDKLQVLILFCPSIVDEDMEIVCDSKDLRALILYCPKLTDAGLTRLGELTKLTEIGLHSPLITDSGMQSLSGLSNLTQFDLELPQVTDAGLAKLPVDSKTEVLWLSLPSVTDQGLLALPHLPNLRKLTLKNMQVSDAALLHLTSSGKLEWLNLPDFKFTDASLPAIGNNPNLRSDLDLSGMPVTDEGIKHLAGQRWRRAMDLSETSITDNGLQHLASCQGLIELALRRTEISGTGLKHLASLHVRVLDLSDSSVTDDGLSSLKGFRELRQLLLADTGIGDQACQHFPLFGQYAKLDLSRTHITDQCVDAIAQIAGGLSELILDGTQITDAGLSSISKRIAPYKLSVQQTRVTPRGIAKYLSFEEEIRRYHSVLHSFDQDEIEREREALLNGTSGPAPTGPEAEGIRKEPD